MQMLYRRPVYKTTVLLSSKWVLFNHNPWCGLVVPVCGRCRAGWSRGSWGPPLPPGWGRAPTGASLEEELEDWRGRRRGHHFNEAVCSVPHCPVSKSQARSSNHSTVTDYLLLCVCTACMVKGGGEKTDTMEKCVVHVSLPGCFSPSANR